MNRMLRTALCLALCLIFLTGSALAEVCKYNNEGPCDVIWWVDSANRKHCRACRNHVEDKIPGNYVMITGWAACTPDSTGECTVCGWDYDRTDTDEYQNAVLTELLMASLMDGGKPVNLTPVGSAIEVEFSDEFIELLGANGVSPSESMSIPTEYELILSGTSFEATGSEIKPASMNVSDYGPGAFLEELGQMTASVSYKNNVNPGTATATLTIAIGDVTSSVSKNFTITGEAAMEDKTLTAVTGDYNVSASGMMSADARLIIIPNFDDIEDDVIESLYDPINTDTHDAIGWYDCYIEGEYEGKIRLTFAVGSEHNGKEAIVVHGKPAGGTETFYTTVENGKVSVEVGSLSPFMIAVEKDRIDGGDDEGGNTPGGEGNEGGEGEKIPETGDASMPLLWAGMILASLVVLAKRRRVFSK